MKKGIAIVQLLFIILSLTSCGKVKGEFSIKYPMDETYRRIHRKPEIRKDKAVKWIYRINSPGKNLTVGVVIMKKEALWIDHSSRKVSVSKGNPIVYGEIKAFLPGEYRIVLTDFVNENKIIDDLYFQVYSDAEDEDLPL